MKVVKQQLRKWRAPIGSLAAIGAILAVLVFAAAAGTGSAGTGSTLKMSVVATNKGPLTACSSAADCGPQSVVRYYLYVENKNPPPPFERGTTPATTTRPALPGSFVVTSVDIAFSVDGGAYGGTGTYVPPPNISPGNGRAWSGHWPSTVSCPDATTTDPCAVVKSPAIVPGERAVAFYWAWGHVAGELNGTYVFRFIVHGTLDGAPVNLTGYSPSIVMTD